MRLIIRTIIISFVLIVLHATLVNVLTIVNAVPNILIIWLVYIAITAGQLSSTVAGFCLGLFVDIISGGIMGLSALSNTIAGFIAGYFYNENKVEQNLSTWTFVVVVGIAAVLHNAVFFTIFLQGMEISWWRALMLHGIPSSVYTIVVGAIPMFVFRRKYQ